MPIIQKKVCLLGAYAVGKTSLVRRYVEGTYSDVYLSTIGVRVSRRTLSRPYGQLELFIWDLASAAEFARSESSYLAGLAGALIVCDLTRPDTLRGMERYISLVQAVNAHAGVAIIGNKIDLVEAQRISQDELDAVCRLAGAPPCILASAKTGDNVEAAFELLAEQLEVKL